MSSNIPLDALHNPDAPFNQEERDTAYFGIVYKTAIDYEQPVSNEVFLSVYTNELPDLQKDLDEAIEEVLNRYNIEK